VLPSNQPTWAVNIGQDGTGVYHDGGSAFDYNQMIDDVGIWRRALTANEALAIYRAGNAGLDFSQAVSATLFFSVVGNSLQITWLGETGVQLEQSPSLTNPNWTAVNGSLNASSATVPITGASAFFRLHRVQ